MTPLERCVGDRDRFARDHWGCKPLHVRRAPDVDFDDLLGVDDVANIIGSAHRSPTLRLVREGRNLDRSTYTRALRLGSRSTTVADLGKVTDAFAEGATIVLQSLHRIWPPLREFAADLVEEISHPVQVNAYLSPPRSVGLASHRDRHDVFALQLAGTKEWTVEGLGEVTLIAGDVLYVPAGTEHQAGTAGESSLHLTVGVPAVTMGDVIKRALGRIDELKRPLPLGFASASSGTFSSATSSSEALHRSIQDAVELVADGLRELDPVELAAAEQRRRQTQDRADDRLAQVIRLHTIELDSVIQKRAGLDVSFEVVGTELVLSRPGRVLHMPASTERAVRTVIEGRNVKVHELEGLDEPSRVVLARRLVQEGFLRVERS